jgi:Transglutaminase-like superfamily/TgpA N-terminal domain/Domain of unknown function (DUF4129)
MAEGDQIGSVRSWARAARQSFRPRLSVVLPWLEVAFVLGALAVTIPLYAACFATSAYQLPMVLAAPVAGAVAVFCAVRKAPVLISTALALVVCVGYLLAAVYRPTFIGWLPTAATWSALRDGVFGGWLQLLTSGRPMDVTPVLLTAPVLICFWSALWAAGSCLRTRFTARPLIPVTLSFLSALLFGGVAVRTSFVSIGIWLLLVVSTLLLRGNRFADRGLNISPETASAIGLDLAAEQRRSLLGRLAFGAPMTILVVAIGVGGTALLPIADGERFDVRTLIEQPVDVQKAINPLATIQTQVTADPAQTLFIVSGLPTRVDRVRTAVLTSFDGATWTARDEQFLPAGRALPTDTPVPPGDAVTMQVSAQRLNSPFLPVVGTPTALQATGLGYGSKSATLVVGGSARVPFSYSVTGLLPADRPSPSTAVISSAAVDPGRYLSLPLRPSALVTIAEKVTESGITPFQKAELLAAYLRAQPYDITARPGHSLGTITRMLSKKNPGDENGFAEQHASAFVVLARILGIPARVAVGYLIESATAANDRRETVITTRNAHGWAEVPVDGYGWVVMETTDLSKTATPQVPVDDVTQPKPSSIDAIPIPDVRGGVAAAEETPWVRNTALTVVIVITVVALLLGLIVGEKLRRRILRRRSSSASNRVIGAWREVQDRLIERGIKIAPSSTALEIGKDAQRQLGESAQASVELAPLVSAALYAPQEPDSMTVNKAWEFSAQLRRDLATSRRWWMRIPAWLDPRPLAWARRPLRRRR